MCKEIKSWPAIISSPVDQILTGLVPDTGSPFSLDKAFWAEAESGNSTKQYPAGAL